MDWLLEVTFTLHSEIFSDKPGETGQHLTDLNTMDLGCQLEVWYEMKRTVFYRYRNVGRVQKKFVIHKPEASD